MTQSKVNSLRERLRTHSLFFSEQNIQDNNSDFLESSP